MDNELLPQLPTTIEHAADIVAAFVSNNKIDASELGALVGSVHGALVRLSEPAPEPKPIPAVNPKKTVFPDHIVSLEDGKAYKTMKRHLSLRGLTPADYRAKWELPYDYPMVAPNYSAARSEMAKTLGLGRKAKKPTKGRKKAAKA